jgi:hypothetical protein
LFVRRLVAQAAGALLRAGAPAEAVTVLLRRAELHVAGRAGGAGRAPAGERALWAPAALALARKFAVPELPEVERRGAALARRAWCAQPSVVTWAAGACPAPGARLNLCSQPRDRVSQG